MIFKVISEKLMIGSDHFKVTFCNSLVIQHWHPKPLFHKAFSFPQCCLYNSWLIQLIFWLSSQGPYTFYISVLYAFAFCNISYSSCKIITALIYFARCLLSITAIQESYLDFDLFMHPIALLNSLIYTIFIVDSLSWFCK